MPKSVVADKNFLETPDLEEFLKEHPDNRVVLHDFSAIESFVGSNPLKNLVRTLSVVSRYPHQVLVLKNQSKLIDMGEINPLFRFDMVDWAQTRGFHTYADDLRKAEAGEAARVALVAEHSQFASAHLQQMLDSMPLMTKLIQQLGIGTPASVVKVRRQRDMAIPRDDAMAILRSIYDIARIIAGTRKRIPAIPDQPSKASRHFVFRFAIALRMFALWWAEQGGGLDEVNPKKLRNDFVDLMYVTCATYWDGFFTKEEKMQKIYDESCYLTDDIFAKIE